MAKRNSNRELYAREAKKLRERIKTAEKRGFIFGEDIQSLTELPKRVTKQAIQKIKNLRGIWLRREAEGYKTGDNNGTVVSAVTGLRLEREKIHKIAKETIRIHEIKKRHEKIHEMERELEREHPEFFDVVEDYEPAFEEENIFYDLPTKWFVPKQEKIVLENFESKLDDFENKLDSVEPQNKNSWQKELEQQNLDSLREIYNNVKNDIGANAMARVIEQSANKLNDILNRASYSYRSRDGAIHGYNPTLDETKFETILRQRVLTTDELKKANERQELGDYEEEFDEE